MSNTKFFKVIQAQPRIPILVHIPHSSTFIPAKYRSDYCVDDAALAEEHRKLVDWHTDLLAAPLIEMGACAVQAEFSRFFVDPERYGDDAQEPMSSVGMGVLYERGCGGERIRNPVSPERRKEILDTFYHPYHNTIHQITEQICKQFGICVLIDMHSYPQFTLPYELHKSASRPEFCLGTDSYHSKQSTIKIIQEQVQAAEYSFAVDQPFVGTYVPLPLYKDPRVFSYMFEIRRDIYMSEINSQLIVQDSERLMRCIAQLGRSILCDAGVALDGFIIRKEANL